MIKSLKALQGIDTGKLAKAIEADAGVSVPDLHKALAEAKAHKFAAVHTPEQIAARRPGRPAGSVKADAKIATNIRLSPEVSAAFRASGPGWQTRIDEALKDWLRTHSPA